MSRRRHVWRCGVCGKSALFTSYEIAARSAARLPENTRVYWSPECGGYHVTTRDRGEYERLRSRSRAENPSTDG